MQIAVLLGAPGSGKGTQAKRLTDVGFKHYSTGDMLRAAIKAGTQLGEKARAFMDKGELVPDPIMIDLIADTFSKLPTDSRILLDGFPRTVPQAEALDANPTTQVGLALNFDLPESLLVERLTGRRTCQECGATYHIKFIPPKVSGVCDRCGSKALMQRSDDTEEVVRRRLSVFNKQNAGLLDYYRKKSVLVTVRADQPPAAIQTELLKKLESWSK
ncbi:MAG: nucleoside monophosphate kinase [Bdellovibrionales bacterium]|nr:nucleoside monophosphate kinase [Bdellovibrionales bacterium]